MKVQRVTLEFSNEVIAEVFIPESANIRSDVHLISCLLSAPFDAPAGFSWNPSMSKAVKVAPRIHVASGGPVK